MSEGLTLSQLAEKNALLVTENAALQQKLDAVLAENVALKCFGDTLRDMHAGLECSGTGVVGEHEAACQQVALDAAMDAFDAINTPITNEHLNFILTEARADGVDKYADALSYQVMKMREIGHPRIRLASVNAESKRARDFAAQLRTGSNEGGV